MVWMQTIDEFRDKPFLAIFKLETVPTENAIFRLFYKLGCWVLLFYLLVYTLLAINPIYCMNSKDVCKKGVIEAINRHCWTYGTFTLEKPDPATQIYPGIGKPTSGSGDIVISYHHYYKYMYAYGLIMFALLFVPKYVWMMFERGRMSNLVGKLSSVVIIGEDETLGKKKDQLVEYLLTYRGYHRLYAFGFVLAEVVNVGVAGVIMCMWDSLVDYEFSRNGGKWYWATHPALWRTDRLAQLFPLVGKCTFRAYGPSGGAKIVDFLCMLPLNVFNERAAVFFWYFFMTLAAIGTAALAFRLLLVFSQRVRIFLLSGVSPLISLEDMGLLVERSSYSDWFMIYQMGNAMESVIFREVLERFIRRLKFEEIGNREKMRSCPFRRRNRY